MGINQKVQEYLNSSRSGDLRAENIPVKMKLSEIKSLNDWPEYNCLGCRSWRATSKELNLGECLVGQAKIGKDPQDLRYPVTPANHYCRMHWGRDEYSREPTNSPEKRR